MVWRPLIFSRLPAQCAAGNTGCLGLVPPLPPERAWTACAFVGRLWCFGGLGRGGRVFRDTWGWDRPMLRWQQRGFIGKPHPPARYGHKAVAVGPHMMVIYGGTDGKQLFGDVWGFDVGSKGWFELGKGGLSLPFGQSAGLHPPTKPRTHGAQYPWNIPPGSRY